MLTHWTQQIKGNLNFQMAVMLLTIQHTIATSHTLMCNQATYIWYIEYHHEIMVNACIMAHKRSHIIISLHEGEYANMQASCSFHGIYLQKRHTLGM